MRIKDLIIFIMLDCLYIGTTLKNFRLFVKKIKKMYFMSVNGKDGRQVQLYESDVLTDREATTSTVR